MDGPSLPWPMQFCNGFSWFSTYPQTWRSAFSLSTLRNSTIAKVSLSQ